MNQKLVVSFMAAVVPLVFAMDHGMHMGNHSMGNHTGGVHTCNFMMMYENLTDALDAADDCGCIGKDGQDYHQMPNDMYMIGNPMGCCGPFLLYATEQEAQNAATACGIEGVHNHGHGQWMIGNFHGCAELVFFDTDPDACSLQGPDSSGTIASYEPLAYLVLAVFSLA